MCTTLTGSIAVYDDDALRFVDFAHQLAKGQFDSLDNGLTSSTGGLYHKVASFLRSKQPGQVCGVGSRLRGRGHEG
jgi:hypothetical protein